MNDAGGNRLRGEEEDTEEEEGQRVEEDKRRQVRHRWARLLLELLLLAKLRAG